MTTGTRTGWIMPLNEPGATLGLAGGKGASLASLAVAGFPVPPGFLITTAAYRRFVAENDLQAAIDASLNGIDPASLVATLRAAEAIQSAFARGAMPPDLALAIGAAYRALGDPPPAVAVRSSATAEDLPGLSFAGQQETMLDVRGQAALLAAVRRCWASLWTARAIGYRQQMGVPQGDASMAVVIQEMVPAELSGVLFTANPASGDRGDLVVEAAPGLGEALVGGTVTPESYVVARDGLETSRFTPADQGAPGTLTGKSAPGVGGERALPAPLLRELAQLGLDVEHHFRGVPQDIEWASAAGKPWLLQARPITTLPPTTALAAAWESPEPGAAWVRRQVVEHMPEPLSPLFAELYLREGLEQSAKQAGKAMGADDLLGKMVAGPFFTTVNGYGYMRGNFNFTRETALPLIGSLVWGPLWVFRHGVDHWREEGLPAYLATIARWQAVEPATASDDELLQGVRELALADALYWFAAAIAIGAAKISDALLAWFLEKVTPGRGLQSGLFLRGFPSKTLLAEAELDAIAARVHADDELRAIVLATSAERLLAALPETDAGRALKEDLDRYFARYGHQIYNLDFSAPTLAESPLPVLLGLKALVREPGRGALARQAEVARQRDQLVAETAQSLDPLRRFFFERIVRWAQRLAPYRDEALFYVGAGWPLLRRFALELGRRLAAAGALNGADDVFFLESGELEQAIAARARGETWPDLARLARERRELREAQRRLHPPPAVPPTARMQLGPLDLSERETQRRNDPNAATLRGFAVSPGRVTAPASVILSPADFAQMEPGTILVCPTTTPAWTPLFAQARGLVTDIGGILAHGSIVAREYGIPAVMGTGSATRRIASGQTITVDGSAGTVSLDGAMPGLAPARPAPNVEED